MSHPVFSDALLARLKALFKGFASHSVVYSPEQIAQRVQLPFTGLSVPQLTISWKNNLSFQHLYDLPLHALSGPVQEDKAHAHALLSTIVTKECNTEHMIDVRDVFGFSEIRPGAEKLTSLESFAASQQCRPIRIISYRDFQRIIQQAVPSFFSEQPIKLQQASWLGPQLFWMGQQFSCEFACATVYARLRGLELSKAAYINRYAIDRDAVRNLQGNYHMLIMPEQAWGDSDFMTILLDSGSPYARLTLSKTPKPIEVLLLPRRQPLADALGKGLRLAGAYDACETLLQLPAYSFDFNPAELPRTSVKNHD